MRILIVTPYYLPDSGPSAPLFTLLSEALVQRGHCVTVICAVPHYPSGKVKTGYQRTGITRSIENGVNILRTPLPSLDRSRLAMRLLQFIVYQVQAAWVGIREQYDICLLTNPFIEVGIPYFILSTVKRKPMIYSIHDVYPDVGVQLGLFKSKWVIQLIKSGEKYCLDRARNIRILSKSFIKPMHSLGVPDNKLTLIYDWVDTELITPTVRDNPFAREFKLADKFVVLYAGNIGLSQGLENVLAAAEILTKYTDILFVFVGDGVGRERLELDAKNKKLKNVVFIPFQKRERLNEVLASADISLVMLLKGVGTGSLPSKSYSIFASGRVILASVDETSDLATLINQSESGLCVNPEDPVGLANAIIMLKEDPLKRTQMGTNGRKWAEKYHTPKAAAREFDSLFKSILPEL